MEPFRFPARGSVSYALGKQTVVTAIAKIFLKWANRPEVKEKILTECIMAFSSFTGFPKL